MRNADAFGVSLAVCGDAEDGGGYDFAHSLLVGRYGDELRADDVVEALQHRCGVWIECIRLQHAEPGWSKLCAARLGLLPHDAAPLKAFG